MKLRKSIAVLLIPLAVVLFAPDAARGANGDLAADSSFSRTMIPGSSSAIPQIVPTGREDEQIFLSWPMRELHGTYRLSYYADNDKKIEFTIDRTNTTAEVRLNTLLWNGSGYQVSGSALYVYTDMESKGYVTVAEFLAKYNVGDPYYEVKPLEGGVTPLFNIKEDTGFSIIYDNVYYHFLWNRLDGRFYLVSDHMKHGRIYNFKLEAPSEPDTYLKVMTGVLMDSFHIIPFANNDVTANDPKFVYDNDLTTYIDEIRMGGTGTDNPPGSPDNKMCLRFDIPMEYNETDRKFNQLPTNKLSFRIRLDHANAANGVEIDVLDII
ncbi:MAG: hypothetical protein LBQ68_05920, partial [Clostridiales bacterium]|nr:hypothetical protein [Clostridiales bacterium]